MKKYLILLFLLTVSLMSDEIYQFQVTNPTMGKAYFNIFNAIVALMKNETYIEMLRIIFLLGTFFVFVLGVFKVFQGQSGKEAIFDTTKYLVAGTTLLTLILPSDSDSRNSILSIESKVISSYYCNAQNEDSYTGFTVAMPQSLAWGFATINTIGVTTTEQAATVFSNVSSNTDVQNAFKESSLSGFGSETEQLQSLMNVKMIDFYDQNDSALSTTSFGTIPVNAALGGYLGKFFQNCVFMISSADSTLGSEVTAAIEKTGNMQKTLEMLYPSSGSGAIVIYKNDSNITTSTKAIDDNASVIPAKMLISIDNSNGDEITDTCGKFYTEVIKNGMDTIKSNNNLACIPVLRKFTPSGLYSIIGTDNVSAPVLEEMAINAGLISAYKEYSDSSRIATDISFAAGKTSAEFVLNNAGQGFYMAKMLPYMQMGIRAVLYAFFPFVFLVMLLPGGFSVIKSYLQSMLWVELWSPVAAILNMFLSYFQIDRVSSVYQNEGLNVTSVSNIVSDSNMLASVGGYLYASVPALTWLVLKGSAQMLGSVTGGMAATFSKNLDSNSMRQDLGKAKAAESISEKTGQNIGIAEMDMNQTLSEAEMHAISQATAYNSTKGYKNYWSDIGESNAQKESEESGRGFNINTDTKHLAEIKGAYTQDKENKFNSMLNNISEEERGQMASAMASKGISADKQELKEIVATGEAIGLDKNDPKFYEKMSDNMSTLNSYNSIEKKLTAMKTLNTYAENHKDLGFDKDESGNIKMNSNNFNKMAKDWSTTDSNEQIVKENKDQTFFSKQGVQSRTVKNEEDFKKSYKEISGGKELHDVSVDNNGIFHGTTEDGEQIYASKNSFLRSERTGILSNSKSNQKLGRVQGTKAHVEVESFKKTLNTMSEKDLINSESAQKIQSLSAAEGKLKSYDKSMDLMKEAYSGDKETLKKISHAKELLNSDKNSDRLKGARLSEGILSQVSNENSSWSTSVDKQKIEKLKEIGINSKDAAIIATAQTARQVQGLDSQRSGLKNALGSISVNGRSGKAEFADNLSKNLNKKGVGISKVEAKKLSFGSDSEKETIKNKYNLSDDDVKFAENMTSVQMMEDTNVRAATIGTLTKNQATVEYAKDNMNSMQAAAYFEVAKDTSSKSAQLKLAKTFMSDASDAEVGEFIGAAEGSIKSGVMVQRGLGLVASVASIGTGTATKLAKKFAGKLKVDKKTMKKFEETLADKGLNKDSIDEIMSSLGKK